MASSAQKTVAAIQPRLLTVNQAAQYLSSTSWAIRKLAWSKTVPFIRLGTRILFDLADLNSFIDRAKIGGKYGTRCSASGKVNAHAKNAS